MQKQAQLLSRKAMTGRTLGFQVQFVLCDLMFRLAASTGDLAVESLSAGVL
jgi:hypothetical protein